MQLRLVIYPGFLHSILLTHWSSHMRGTRKKKLVEVKHDYHNSHPASILARFEPGNRREGSTRRPHHPHETKMPADEKRLLLHICTQYGASAKI